MALQRHGISGTEPLNYGGKVVVVSKTTSNGIAIPIEAGPYGGKHLDTKGGNSPDENTYSFGIGPETYDNLIGGGTFYSTTLDNLIWCGKLARVPDKELELDVSVALATADTQTISVGGVDIKGKWSGYWSFEAPGTVLEEKNLFDGKSVRVPASNPYTTFVFFVFVEDPPDRVGKITTTRNFSGTDPVSTNVTLTNNINSWSDSSSDNPWQRGSLWINKDSIKGTESNVKYTSTLTVPIGYRVKSSQGGTLACTAAGNTGNCSIGGIGLADGQEVNVVFELERNLKGTIYCAKSNDAYYFNGSAYDGTQPNTAPSIRFQFSNISPDAGDLNKTIVASAPGNLDRPYSFSLRMDNRLHDNKPHELKAYMKLANGTEEQLNIGAPNTIVFGPDTPCGGTVTPPELCPQGTKLAGLPKPADGNCNPTPPELCPAGSKYAGLPKPADGNCNPSGSELCPAGSKYAGLPKPADGNCNPTLPELCPAGSKYAGLPKPADGNCDPPSICPSFPGQDCRVEPYFYPWLQTKGGDVVSNGKINGQISGDSYLGSRKPNQTDKEAEFLVVAAVGGGGPFCSTYNYILTNTNAKTSCSNGAGYSILNTYSLTTGADDNAVIGANKAYNELAPACKKGSNLPPNTIIESDLVPCPKGSMYKLPANSSLGNITIKKGQVTIVVDGDLTITGNISYDNPSVTDPRDLPSLAIVAKGNITIDPGVKEINALIYSAGSLNTCGAEAKLCNKQLKINGSLVAKAGFKFARTYTSSGTLRQNDPDASRDAAEIITLTPQTIAFPPPGIDISYFSVQASSVNLDSAEYNPRF